jgi:hypothetical protein
VSWSKSYIWRTGEEAPRIWEAIGQPGGLLPNTAAQRGCRAGRIEPTAATHPTTLPRALQKMDMNDPNSQRVIAQLLAALQTTSAWRCRRRERGRMITRDCNIDTNPKTGSHRFEPNFANIINIG